MYINAFNNGNNFNKLFHMKICMFSLLTVSLYAKTKTPCSWV